MQEVIGDARYTIAPKCNKLFFEMATVVNDTTVFNSTVLTVEEALYLRDCLSAVIGYTSRSVANARPFTV